MLFEPSLLIAAAASFIAGVLGYIIARLWIKPIVRYNILKRRLDQELRHYLNAYEASAQTTTPPRRRRHRPEPLRSARRYAMDLVACYSRDIPYWYRLLLDSRGESPAEASGQLTNLAKIDDQRLIVQRIDKARRSMHL